jgi:hypothetical protein
MSSLSALSVTALGPKAVTKPSASAAKVTMPLCGQWPLNGSGSSSPVGNSASPTILNAICKPCKLAVQSTPRSPPSLHPQAVNKISSKTLTDQLRSLVAPCAAGPLRATPASASLLRDLLTAIAPSKRFLSFAFVSLFARDLAPSKQPQKVQYRKSDVLERTSSNTDYYCY